MAAAAAGAFAVCSCPLSREGSYGGSGLQQLAQVVLGVEYSLPRITIRFKNVRGGSKGEVGGIHPLQIIPAHRHVNGAEGVPPGREDRDEGFPAGILVVVEEDLS